MIKSKGRKKGVRKMSIPEAQRRAVQKYNSANYDDIKLRVPKGFRDELKAIAESQGISVNAFIQAAISEKIERDGCRG